MKHRIGMIAAFATVLGLHAATCYVDNVKGNDANDGSKEHPVASLEKGLVLLKKSDRLEVAPNGGKPYRRPYPGVIGKALRVTGGGTAESPMVVNGNGAVISGLAAIPADCWTATEDGLWCLPFWPMSNQYRHYDKQDYWLPESRIFFLDGQPAKNCLSRTELQTSPGGFWWSRKERKLFFKPPAGKQPADVSVELPANSGFYILDDHTRVENFAVILSWNDGFDTNGRPHNVVYRNCAAVDNCGQAFSCHDAGIVYYEDCVAIRCASSGACDVHHSNSSYVRCVFADNVFEGGVAANDCSAHTYSDCLIVGNRPFEQIWQNQNSRMSFDNCVISGRADSGDLLFLRNGSASFLQCSLLNARCLNRGMPDNYGSLRIENSLIAGMREALIDVPRGMENRIRLAGNIYCGNRGFRISGKLLAPGEPAGTFDTGSQWIRDVPGGRLNSELGKSIRTPGVFGTKRSVGAHLPESVWANCEKYRKARTSPAGLSFE